MAVPLRRRGGGVKAVPSRKKNYLKTFFSQQRSSEGGSRLKGGPGGGKSLIALPLIFFAASLGRGKQVWFFNQAEYNTYFLEPFHAAFSDRSIEIIVLTCEGNQIINNISSRTYLRW